MIHEEAMPTVLDRPKTGDVEVGGGRSALELVTRLCAALERSDVRYCHWKSNQALDRSASGENDLDLLVDRSGVGRFEELLHDLGFKEALEPARKRFPGIRHYFGLDAPSGKIVNVHAHEQLVIGDDATKNYRLPIEEPYLGSVTRDPPFMVPSAEFEFVVFAIRMMLKHGTWDATLSLRGRLSKAERGELVHLTSRVDQARVAAILTEHLPFLDQGVFHRCVRSLEPGGSTRPRMRASRDLHRSLAPCARRHRRVDAFLRIWRRLSNRILRRVFRPALSNRLAAGGAVVAIVGGDGAGKSTVVHDLRAWLSPYLLVRTKHLGKPPLGAASFVVRAFMRLGRSVGVVRARRAGAASTGGFAPLSSIRDTLTARDRYRAHVRARRAASRGAIVVCDRYPLPAVAIMDGPRVGEGGTEEHLGRWGRRLASLEARFYARIGEPDALIVLAVDPEVAVRRRAGDDEVVVRARSTAILATDWHGASACVVDANAPRDDVFANVKSLVWSRL